MKEHMNQLIETEKERFPFGDNWKKYLNVLTDAHINEAEKALKDFLGVKDLKGKRFLDIGSGSGLHSLAARKMGAEIFSFDYDAQSVACTEELKRRFFPNDLNWEIGQGSVLNRSYMDQLGSFDVAYAWGVLHHTGSLWQAIYNAQRPLKPGGLLFIAIYNDQGLISSFWRIIKRTYCSGPMGKLLMASIFYPFFFFAGLLIDILHFRNPGVRYQEHKKYRGMSLLHDWRDWLGGYPFEPANSQEVISFVNNLGFELVRYESTRHGFGNNQFLFKKIQWAD